MIFITILTWFVLIFTIMSAISLLYNHDPKEFIAFIYSLLIILVCVSNLFLL